VLDQACDTLPAMAATAAKAPAAPVRLELAGPVEPSRLLGRPLADERELTLASSPAYVACEDIGGGTRRYIAVFGQALGRRALMDLLYVLAPYKAHGPDRFARVLDNWGIFDRAAANATSNSLFQQHVKGLGSNWSLFAEHRELYMAVLNDQAERTRLVPVLAWDRDAEGGRKWQFRALSRATREALEASVPVLAPGATGQLPHLDTLIGLVTLPYFQPQLRRSWPAWRPLVKDGKSNYIGPASVPVMALLHRRALLRSSFLAATEDFVAAERGAHAPA
jgi:hypothetical protein